MHSPRQVHFLRTINTEPHTFRTLQAKQISATNWSDLSMVGVHPDEQTMSATSLHERLVENLRNTDAKYCAEAKVCSENLFMDYRVWRRALNYKASPFLSEDLLSFVR